MSEPIEEASLPILTPDVVTAKTRLDAIRLPARRNDKLRQIIERVNAHTGLRTLWQVQNVTAITRLGMNDHGPVHMQVVANIALKLLRMLTERGITPNIVKDYEDFGFEQYDAEVVVVLAALMHDLGMSIHRIDHETYSLFVAQPILDDILRDLYGEAERTVMRSEVLHAIISHRAGGAPLTLEAGVVRFADALDMAKGRSRIPFEAGHVNIHSVSAAAIEKVDLGSSETRPVRVRIHMNNSAGIFQVDELMKDKLTGSGLEAHIEVEAVVDGEAEKPLFHILHFPQA
ncbi:MAG: HD domain-containing protein [Chloroflexi bacterium]|nr:HD domain-containing protein [Chloroflexota bacterium]